MMGLDRQGALRNGMLFGQIEKTWVVIEGEGAVDEGGLYGLWKVVIGITVAVRVIWEDSNHSRTKYCR